MNPPQHCLKNLMGTDTSKKQSLMLLIWSSDYSLNLDANTVAADQHDFEAIKYGNSNASMVSCPVLLCKFLIYEPIQLKAKHIMIILMISQCWRLGMKERTSTALAGLGRQAKS